MSPQDERLLLNEKTQGFLAPGGEEFNPGPETRLDHSELLCNKVLLKYKGKLLTQASEGGRKSVPLLVFNWMLYSHQQSVNERNVLKLRMAPGPSPIRCILDNLDTKLFILGHKMINLNLVEGQITIQIVSFTQIRETISEYNILICQVGSEPRGGTDLKTEFGVNAQHISIA